MIWTDGSAFPNELGYDGAFYSWDGKTIVYRAWHHTDSASAAEYRGFSARTS
jgi:hypothetical protein